MQSKIKVVDVNIDDLQLDPSNPRRNDAAVPGVRESIKQFGFRVPIVIDKNYVVKAGNTRLKAARELGLTEIPCVIADELNEKELKAFQLADNKTGEFASWDAGLLASELDDLIGAFDMEVFGFNLKGKESKKKETKDPQFVTCPRCGARIPRKKAIEWTVEDFEHDEGGDLA